MRNSHLDIVRRGVWAAVVTALLLGAVAAIQSCGSGAPAPEKGSAAAPQETVAVAPPTLDHGAIAYLAYCAVCHGSQGAGDGPLAAEFAKQGAADSLELDDSMTVIALGRDGVMKAIAAGAAHTGRLNLTPPWSSVIDEGTRNDIAAHVLTLADTLAPPMAEAMTVYLASPLAGAPSARESYVYFCSSCHGEHGKGDGPAAALIADANHIHVRNLTDRRYFSDRTDAQINAALSLGGGHVGRSIYMPAWNHPFTTEQVAEFVAYVRHMSHTPQAQVASTP